MKGLKYLQSKKDWFYEEVAASQGQYVIQACPLCDDDRSKFYMNKDGLWDCKICGESGNLYQLKAKLGELNEVSTLQDVLKTKYKPLEIERIENYIKELKTCENAYEYLTDRGFSNETIKHFKLGLRNNEEIAIPHFQDGQLWNIKFRNYKEKKFVRINGQPTVLFNIDGIDFDKSSIVIVESETDCMSAWQMGIKNVISLTSGAKAFKEEWVKMLKSFKRVFICLNSDDVGQQGAYKLAEKIGLQRCYNVKLPTNDINDYLNTCEKENFIQIFKDAKRFNIQSITNLSEYIDSLDSWLDDEGAVKGLNLQRFATTNFTLNGFKAEDLIVLSGDSGMGKTTMLLNMLLDLLEQGHRCFFFCLEGKIQYYILRMMAIKTNKRYEDLQENKKEWEDIKNQFREYELIFYSGAQVDMNENKMRELLPAGVKLYDINFVAIDNLQEYVTEDKNIVQNTSRSISDLKNLAVDLKIPIFIISHIRKFADREQSRPTMQDAKASSTIYQKADVYMNLWIKKKGDSAIAKEKYYLSIDKNRMGEGGIDVELNFNKKTATFTEK